MTTQLPPYQYGGLMVPHPELILATGRPKPSWGPVAAWTFFTGLFGAIPAALRADKAKRAGHGQHPYWIAFGVTLAVSMLVWWAAANVGLRTYLHYQQEALEASVSSDLKAQPAAKGVSITGADCEALHQKGPGGYDAYTCDVILSTGKTGAVTVLADSHGAVKGIRQN
jgi:hypothetical protein